MITAHFEGTSLPFVGSPCSLGPSFRALPKISHCGKEVVMSRKRSLKNRYFRFLRRIWPAPTLAATALALAACASRPAAGSPLRTAAAAAVPSQTRSDADELRYEWKPQLVPTQLHLIPEFQFDCAPVVGLPPSLVLEEKSVVDALEPIASCLTLGPKARAQLQPLASSEFSGGWNGTVHGSRRADQLRSSVSLLGVPFEDLVAYDVDNGNDVELGVAPGSS
jgi:hypothetical protein